MHIEEINNKSCLDISVFVINLGEKQILYFACILQKSTSLSKYYKNCFLHCIALNLCFECRSYVTRMHRSQNISILSIEIIVRNYATTSTIDDSTNNKSNIQFYQYVIIINLTPVV